MGSISSISNSQELSILLDNLRTSFANDEQDAEQALKTAGDQIEQDQNS